MLLTRFFFPEVSAALKTQAEFDDFVGSGSCEEVFYPPVPPQICTLWYLAHCESRPQNREGTSYSINYTWSGSVTNIEGMLTCQIVTSEWNGFVWSFFFFDEEFGNKGRGKNTTFNWLSQNTGWPINTRLLLRITSINRFSYTVTVNGAFRMYVLLCSLQVSSWENLEPSFWHSVWLPS